MSYKIVCENGTRIYTSDQDTALLLIGENPKNKLSEFDENDFFEFPIWDGVDDSNYINL